MSRRIVGLSSMATRQVLADLAREHERRTGLAVEMRAMGGVEAAKRVRAGEPSDVVVLAGEVMRRLAAEGHVVAASLADFARSEIAVAVAAGALRPGLDSEAAVRRAVLAARRICCSTGPSGDHVKALCEKWGLGVGAERLLVAPPGVPVASLVARGDADIGFQQWSELLGQPGVDVVGPLPPDIQAVTVFSAGVSANSSDRDAARAFVAYLASDGARAAKRRYGMDGA